MTTPSASKLAPRIESHLKFIKSLRCGDLFRLDDKDLAFPLGFYIKVRGDYYYASAYADFEATALDILTQRLDQLGS